MCRLCVGCATMSRRDDRDRSRTRRRRDRSPSPQARKARRHEHNDNQVSEGMDWNNLASWQHNSGYNSANNFPVMQTNYQSIPNPTQQFHHSPINYMMPAPPEPTPTKFITPVMPPPVNPSQATGHLEMACYISTSSTTSACPRRSPTPRTTTYVTCPAWTFVTLAWFRSFMEASPTGCSGRLLTADS